MDPVVDASTSFAFPSPTTADEHGKVLVGGDLESTTLLEA